MDYQQLFGLLAFALFGILMLWGAFKNTGSG